jgi:solute carrier family 30 (zinc transporter), member 2
MSFGYYRSEVLGALFSTLLIWVLTGVLVYLAIVRLITRDFEIESTAMLITASCGVVFNIIMYFILHTNRCFSGVQLNHGHSHAGGGSHSHHSHHSHANSNHSHGGSHASKRHLHSHSHSAPNLPINDNYDESSTAVVSDKVNIIVTDGCDELEDVQVIDESANINLRAAAIHVIGDFIQSVGVLIASLIIYFEVYNNILIFFVVVENFIHLSFKSI